jgi:uncharacterized membrane protein
LARQTTLEMKSKAFHLFYYSQLQLVLIAMALTAASSAVLMRKIAWEGIWIVGLSTFITYNLDNLIDWKRDVAEYQDIKHIIPYYHKFCYIAMPVCAVGIVALIIQGNAVFQIGVLLLGATAVITIFRLPIFNKVLNAAGDFTGLLWNRIFISFVWTAVCVFTPVWYSNQQITPQAWMTYVYLWQLIFINALLWKLEKYSQRHITKQNLALVLLILQGLCITSTLLAIVDIILGYFPLHNLVVTLAPFATFLVIRYWLAGWKDLRIIFTFLVFVQTGCSILTIFVHL